MNKKIMKKIYNNLKKAKFTVIFNNYELFQDPTLVVTTGGGKTFATRWIVEKRGENISVETLRLRETCREHEGDEVNLYYQKSIVDYIPGETFLNFCERYDMEDMSYSWIEE